MLLKFFCLVSCFIAFVDAHAQENSSALSVGAGIIRYDTVKNNSGQNEPKPTLLIKYSKIINRNITLGANIRYNQTPEVGAGITVVSSIINYMIESKYLFESVESGPYVDARMGLVSIYSEIKSGGTTIDSTTTNALGVGGGVGYAIPISDHISIAPEVNLLSVRTPEAQTFASADLNAVFSW